MNIPINRIPWGSICCERIIIVQRIDTRSTRQSWHSAETAQRANRRSVNQCNHHHSAASSSLFYCLNGIKIYHVTRKAQQSEYNQPGCSRFPLEKWQPGEGGMSNVNVITYWHLSIDSTTRTCTETDWRTDWLTGCLGNDINATARVIVVCRLYAIIAPLEHVEPNQITQTEAYSPNVCVRIFRELCHMPLMRIEWPLRNNQITSQKNVTRENALPAVVNQTSV